MTIATMAAGLVPLLWAKALAPKSCGAWRRRCSGGLVTSAFLTLEVLPVLYTLWRHRQLRRAERTGNRRWRPSWAGRRAGRVLESRRAEGGTQVQPSMLRPAQLPALHSWNQVLL